MPLQVVFYRWIFLFFILLLGPTGLTLAQQRQAFPVTASYGVDGLVGSSNPGSVYTTSSNIVGTVTGSQMRPSTPSAHFLVEELGLLPSSLAPGFVPNINAIANGADVYPAEGIINIATATFDVSIEFSVSRDEGDPVLGHPGFYPDAPQNAFVMVTEEYLGDGACSDTFEVRVVGNQRRPLVHASNHLGINGAHTGVVETEIDGLCASERRSFPLYFSLDRPTAAALSAAYSPLTFWASDILIKYDDDPLVPPSVYIAGASMGLTIEDNVDAIMLDRRRNNTNTREVVFSLDRWSPSLETSWAPNLNVGASGLFRYSVDINNPSSWSIEPWALPHNLGLTSGSPFESAVGRDLDGVATHDPPILDAPDLILPAVGPPLPNTLLKISGIEDGSAPLLTVDQSDGGRDRVLLLETNRPTTFRLHHDALVKPAEFVVAARLGSFVDGLYTTTLVNRNCFVGLPGMTIPVSPPGMSPSLLVDWIVADSSNQAWGFAANLHNFPSTPAVINNAPVSFDLTFPPLPGFEIRVIMQAFVYPPNVGLANLAPKDVEVGNAIELIWSF